MYANPAAKDALGGGEVAGRHFRELVREDYRDVADRFYGDQVSQRIPNTYCEFPAGGEGRRRLDRPADAARHGGRAHHRLSRPWPATSRRGSARSRRWSASAQQLLRDRGARPGGHGPPRPRAANYLAHSAKWLKYLGLEGQSIIGRASSTRSRPRSASKYAQVMERALQGELVCDPEDSVEREDGSRVYMRWTVHPWRGPQGMVDGVVVVAQNIDVLVRRAPGRPRGLAAQVRVHGQHEPRDPHADERRDRDDPPPPRHRAHAGAARVRGDHRYLRPRPARDHQRHPRLLEESRRGGSSSRVVDFDLRRLGARRHRLVRGARRRPRAWSSPA